MFTFTMFLRHMQSASNGQMKMKNNTLSVCDRNWRINSFSLVQIQSLDVWCFPLNLAVTYKRFAVVAETVVGATTGVVPAPKGYFKGDPFISCFQRYLLECFVLSAMKSVCDKYGALFILDEVRPIPIFLVLYLMAWGQGHEWHGAYVIHSPDSFTYPSNNLFMQEWELYMLGSLSGTTLRYGY